MSDLFRDKKAGLTRHFPNAFLFASVDKIHHLKDFLILCLATTSIRKGGVHAQNEPKLALSRSCFSASSASSIECVCKKLLYLYPSKMFELGVS